MAYADGDGTEGGWRIMRNGKQHACRQTLGEARSLVGGTIRYAGGGDVWEILDGDGSPVPLTANKNNADSA